MRIQLEMKWFWSDQMLHSKTHQKNPRSNSKNPRSKLKDNPFEAADGSRYSVYLADDLTKTRAQMAYEARQLKRAGLIQDTWTFDSKILIKDLRNRIKPVMHESDLQKFRQPSTDSNTTEEA